MGIFELFIIAIGLSMDTFAVSLCKGLSMKKLNYSHALVIAILFGIFQGAMPFIGWLLGKQFESYITSFDHWIAFILLSFIGWSLLKESFNKDEGSCDCDYKLDIKELTILAIATSIDALAVGITFSFLKVSILPSITLIGVITFILSFFGVTLGNRFGVKYKSKAEFLGGFALISMGVKILLEHLI